MRSNGGRVRSLIANPSPSISASNARTPQAALSTIQMIDDAIRQVQAFPSMGRRVVLEDTAHHDYHRVLAGMYAVFYRFDSKRIVVYRILHRRRDIADYSFVDLGEEA